MYIFQPDRYLLKRQIAKLAKYIQGEVLDIGAGPFDRYSDLFTSTRYVRMETQPSPGIDIVGSAEAIPCPDGSFDAVVCTQVLEHVPHPHRVIAEIARVLRPGGHCLMTVPQSGELHELPHDYFRYTRFGVESLFRDKEMKLLDVDRRGGFWVLTLHTGIRYLTERWHLYRRKFLGRLMSAIFRAAFPVAVWLDEHDHSTAGQHHTIGWALVFHKVS